MDWFEYQVLVFTVPYLAFRGIAALLGMRESQRIKGKAS